MSLEKRARQPATVEPRPQPTVVNGIAAGVCWICTRASERQEGDEGDAAGSEGGGGLVWYVKGERNNGLRGRCDDDDVSGMEIHSSDRDRSRSRSRSIGCAVPLSRIASRCSAVDVAIMRGAKGVGRSVGRSEWSALQISFDRRPRARASRTLAVPVVLKRRERRERERESEPEPELIFRVSFGLLPRVPSSFSFYIVRGEVGHNDGGAGACGRARRLHK